MSLMSTLRRMGYDHYNYETNDQRQDVTKDTPSERRDRTRFIGDGRVSVPSIQNPEYNTIVSIDEAIQGRKNKSERAAISGIANTYKGLSDPLLNRAGQEMGDLAPNQTYIDKFVNEIKADVDKREKEAGDFWTWGMDMTSAGLYPITGGLIEWMKTGSPVETFKQVLSEMSYILDDDESIFGLEPRFLKFGESGLRNTPYRAEWGQIMRANNGVVGKAVLKALDDTTYDQGEPTLHARWQTPMEKMSDMGNLIRLFADRQHLDEEIKRTKDGKLTKQENTTLAILGLTTDIISDPLTYAGGAIPKVAGAIIGKPMIEQGSRLAKLAEKLPDQFINEELIIAPDITRPIGDAAERLKAAAFRATLPKINARPIQALGNMFVTNNIVKRLANPQIAKNYAEFIQENADEIAESSTKAGKRITAETLRSITPETIARDGLSALQIVNNLSMDKGAETQRIRNAVMQLSTMYGLDGRYAMSLFASQPEVAKRYINNSDTSDEVKKHLIEGMKIVEDSMKELAKKEEEFGIIDQGFLRGRAYVPQRKPLSSIGKKASKEMILRQLKKGGATSEEAEELFENIYLRQKRDTFTVDTGQSTVAEFMHKKVFKDEFGRLQALQPTELDFSILYGKRALESLRMVQSKRLHDEVLSKTDLMVPVGSDIAADNTNRLHKQFKENGFDFFKATGAWKNEGDIYYAMPSDMAKSLKGFNELVVEASDPTKWPKAQKRVRGFLDVWKANTSLWRQWALATVGFSGRNLMSATFTNYVAGVVNPARYFESALLQYANKGAMPRGMESFVQWRMGGVGKNPDGTKKTMEQTLETFMFNKKDGTKVSGKEMLKMMDDTGIMGGDFTTTEMAELAGLEQSTFDVLQRARKIPVGAIRAGLREGDNLGWGNTDDRVQEKAGIIQSLWKELKGEEMDRREALDVAELYDSIARQEAWYGGSTPDHWWNKKFAGFDAVEMEALDEGSLSLEEAIRRREIGRAEGGMIRSAGGTGVRTWGFKKITPFRTGKEGDAGDSLDEDLSWLDELSSERGKGDPLSSMRWDLPPSTMSQPTFDTKAVVPELKNEDGTLIPLYHGTMQTAKARFTEFGEMKKPPAKGPKATEGGFKKFRKHSRGTWVTTDPKIAGLYTDDHREVRDRVIGESWDAEKVFGRPAKELEKEGIIKPLHGGKYTWDTPSAGRIVPLYANIKKLWRIPEDMEEGFYRSGTTGSPFASQAAAEKWAIEQAKKNGADAIDHGPQFINTEDGIIEERIYQIVDPKIIESALSPGVIKRGKGEPDPLFEEGSGRMKAREAREKFLKKNIGKIKDHSKKLKDENPKTQTTLKGMITWLENGKALISATKDATTSTLLHELGHLVRRSSYGNDKILTEGDRLVINEWIFGRRSDPKSYLSKELKKENGRRKEEGLPVMNTEEEEGFINAHLWTNPESLPGEKNNPEEKFARGVEQFFMQGGKSPEGLSGNHIESINRLGESMKNTWETWVNGKDKSKLSFEYPELNKDAVIQLDRLFAGQIEDAPEQAQLLKGALEVAEEQEKGLAGRIGQWATGTKTPFTWDSIDDDPTTYSTPLGIKAIREALGNNAYIRAMRGMARATEHNARGAHFIQRIIEGDTAEQAAMSTKKHLFDYSELTDFEKSVMREVIPFYTWLRKNIPLQMEMVLRRPDKYANIGKLYKETGYMSEEELGPETDVPDYFRERNAMRLPFTLEDRPTYIVPDLPFVDLLAPTSAIDYDQWIRNTALNIHPVARWGVEALANEKFLTGAPVSKERATGIPDKPIYLDDIIPFSWLGLEGSEYDDIKKINITEEAGYGPYLHHMATSLLPAISRSNIHSKNVKKGQPQIERMLRYLGVPIRTVDVDEVTRQRRYKELYTSKQYEREVRAKLKNHVELMRIKNKKDLMGLD